MRKKTTIISQILIASALMVAYLVNGCEQDPITCQVGRGVFAGKLYYTGETPFEDLDVACQRKGEIFGLHTFYYSDGNEVDFDRARFAIRPGAFRADEYTDSLDTTDGHLPYSIGDFTTGSPTNNKCEVGELNVTEMNYPQVENELADGGIEVTPAKHLSYEWSNVNVLVSTAWIGTQAVADLKYTDHLADCEATFRVEMVYPARGCETDKDCAAEGEGASSGSGISPDFKIMCDTEIAYSHPWYGGELPGTCVLKELSPALK